MSTDACLKTESAGKSELLNKWNLHLEQVRKQSEALSMELLWQVLCELQQVTFHTVKDIPFTYRIRGYEMFVDRKEKSITQATVLLSAQRVLEKQHQGIAITGPKKIGTFGASYLYPIFQQIGLILSE